LKLNANKIIDDLVNEIKRLQTLCNTNGIDYTPPANFKPTAALTLIPKVSVYDTKQEAEQKINH
jgi:hypothetical protein